MRICTVSMLAAVAAALLVPSACALYSDAVIVYGLPAAAAAPAAPRDEGDFLVLMSVTGGGSRAALWHAAVMKELNRQVKLADGKSVTDEVDYISSVSGGSVSSAYWCLNKPEADSTETRLYDAFFKAYLADMRVNIEAKMAGGPFTWYRYLLSPEDRVVVLEKTFDKLYFNHGTFAAIADKERRGTSPVLIANGTEMETGAKFLFTTLPRSDFEVRPERMARGPMRTLAENGIAFGADVFNVVTPEDIGLSIMDMEVSRAAAASSSVPLLLGPVVLKDNKKSTPGHDVYVHISDGGVNDNQGLFTLIELLYKHAERDQKTVKGALVLVVDANPSIEPRGSEDRVRSLSTVETIERSYYICFHQGRAFTLLTIMDILKSDPRLKDVTFVYLSPYVSDDPEVADIFTRTPTRFKITPKEADTIERAAAIVVEKARDRILEELRKQEK